ncbi:MAG TPA: tol-pal system-associated acyl-CoA thioesterase [Gammaproteobacteria bacterium]|nr:tol-pal system-associated acyl-CoA thioesterase [Gammaproteobacteria bacterium]
MTQAKRGTGHVRRVHNAIPSRHDSHKPVLFRWPVRVYYEDTDAGGVVYHANYLRFMERARTEWLRTLGFEQDVLRSRFGVLFVVTAAEVRFRRAARFNDELDVSVAVAQAGRASLGFEQHIRQAQRLMCEAEIRVACVDAETFKPRPVPREIAAELRS